MREERIRTVINPMTGKVIIRKRYALVWGLTKEELNIVKKIMPKGKYELSGITDFMTDIISLNAFIVIINPDNISLDDINDINEWYLELNGCYTENIVFTKKSDKLKLLNKKIKFIACDDNASFCENIKYAILNSIRKAKKNEGFSNQLSNAITVLSEIRKNNGITTKQLAEKIEVSDRTAQRIIESLRIAGEWIEYDRKLKGWKLTDGISILFGDI